MKAKKLLSAVLSAALVLGSAALPANAEDDVWITSGISRDADNIGTNRGLVAVKTADGVFLSWRLFESEDSVFGTADNGVKFNVYKNGSLIKENLNNTNYTDASGKAGDIYKVEPVGGGVSGEAEMQPNQYFDIPLQKPAAQTVEDGNTVSYAPNDVSTGDIDGDGELELVLKWDANGQDNSNSGVTGNVIIDAYKQDGTLLWRVDLGRNIRAGAHYTQFLVYDFDGDGKAEMTCKTAPGSKDSAGNYVSKASLDESISGISDAENQKSYVDGGGRVPDGAEYYTLFESDGTAADTIYYPYDRDCGLWGRDSSGKVDTWNRVDRFLGTVAYLDGVHPAAVTLRGYYDKTTLAAYTVENGRLKLQASFNADSGAQFSGQGNHNITVADVDNDGKDEVLTGAICWDDDLSVLWCAGRGHGDALHIADYDPTHPGYEYFSVHESGGYTIGNSSTTASKGQTADYGMTVYDAATGEELLHMGNTKDTGRGVMANIGSGGYYQISGSANMQSNGGKDFTYTNAGPGSNFRIFWDGDLYDEILDGVNISDYQDGSIQRIFSADGCVSNNGTKANPGLQADLFGDWREEVVYPTSDGNYLRVYTTTIPTEYKMKSLMTDSVYRSGIAAEQTAYNQPPHIGYYLDADVLKALKKITLTPPSKTTYKYGESLDTTGMKVTAEYEDGSTEETRTYTISGYNKNLVGMQTVTVSVRSFKVTFTVEVTTDFVIEDGEVTGYNGAGGAESIPAVYNSKPVTAVASGALAGSGITELTVPDSVENIAAGAIDASVKIKCTEGSAAHQYALENGNPVELTKNILESYAYADYDTEEYAEMNDMVFTLTEQSKNVGNILYRVGGRNRSGQAGEENTGIRFVTEESGNKYAAVTAGRFSDSGRNAYIHLGGVEGVNQQENDFVLSMKLRFEEPVNGGKVQLALTNQNVNHKDTSLISDCVDLIEAGERGLDYGKWYSYSLISRNGKYYRVIQDLETEGAAASVEVIGDSDGTLPSYIGAYKYGESGNGKYGTVDIDDLMAYSCESAFANLTVYLRYADDRPVANHAVTVNGAEYMTDESGKAVLMDIMPGRYEVSATVDGQVLSDSVYASGDSYAWLTVPIEDITAEYTWNMRRDGEGVMFAAENDGAMISIAGLEKYELKAIAAVYQEGTLVYTAIADTLGNESVGFDLSGAVLDAAKEAEVKVFVWSGTDTIRPLADMSEKLFPAWAE